MANKYIDDKEKQLYTYSFPQVYPDGSEISVYTSPENSRMLIKHKSGSHIEFKEDGTIAIKAVKDLHVNTSVNSGASEETSKTNFKVEADLNIEVLGKLTINCREFDLVGKESCKLHSGSGDMVLTGNNIVEKAKEQISMEGTKSIYTSTNEMREKVTTRTSEIGTRPDAAAGAGGGVGGQSTMIENQDPKGGITIKSAGYTNILTAAERIDLTGNPGVMSPVFDPTPLGMATYTHIISPYPGPTPKGVPGSAFFQCGPGGLIEKIVGPVFRSNVGPTFETYVGPYLSNYTKTKINNIALSEVTNVGTVFIVNSGKMIFLNWCLKHPSYPT